MIEATAYHEAGHAVAAFVHRIPIKLVSIVPDVKRGSAGHVRLGRLGRASLPWRGRLHSTATSLAACAAHHMSGDCQSVVDYAFDCTGSAEQAGLLIRLWRVQARDLVEARWSSVQVVAEALLQHRALDADQVRAIMLNVDQNSGAAGV